MRDQEVIQSAYEDAVKTAFKTFVTNISVDDPAADSNFKNALDKARQARDCALKHL